MQTTAFVDGTVLLPDRELVGGAVLVADGRIVAIAEDPAECQADERWQQAEQIDASALFVSPGFVDLHVHGGDGADFMDGAVEAARTACQAHLRHGTTTIFPTTATGQPAQIHAMLDACRAVARDESGPFIPGIHLYGPYFAEGKVGCHSPDGRRSPSVDEYQAYFETDFVRIATCAAELPGAAEFYQAARQRNCLITCGHSNATWPEMQHAFEHGMRHVDHFWCAMSSIASLKLRCGVPMQASMAEFVLMNPEMSTEVIADGYHLSPELLEFAYRMLGPERLCLVTDANRALDLPPGEYRFGDQADETLFRSDGHVGWAADGQSLASSIVGMDHMVRHMFHNTSATRVEVIRMATLTPAQRTGLSHEVGSIQVGNRADLLLLDSDLKIHSVHLGTAKG